MYSLDFGLNCPFKLSIMQSVLNHGSQISTGARSVDIEWFALHAGASLAKI